MSYELHIEQLGQNKHGEAFPIPLDAWKAAVSATPGVRLCAPGIRKMTYPHGASINFSIQNGDLEVYFPEKEAWEPVFHWRKGSASVNASFDPGDSSDPVWTAMVALASRLGATIRGDDGECYDLQTGEISDA